MRLKQLKVHGFKSFADELTFSFTEGVTCIVGPNGCGKSNVCDAIKWVLGEQNARNIRSGGQGRTMQEVIFKGTNTRRPMSYCEVTLTFDNTSRFYNVDADELSITRKLYRSGDSEYFINSSKAKLKDIIALFRDTGIGKDGYSVVGQGQVDAILSAKPEERRQIFEEAAGISGFKASRKESLARLERVSENARSISGELKTLEDVLAPLRKEAEVAEKARVINERIRLLDINHFLYVSDHSEEERIKLREKLDKARGELAGATLDRDEALALYNETKQKLEQLDYDYKDLQQRRLELSLEETARDKDGQYNREKLSKIEADLTKLGRDISDKQSQIVRNNALIEENAGKTETLGEEYAKAKQEEQEAEARYSELSSSVAQKDSQITLTNTLLLQNAEASGELSADLASLKAKKIGLEENVERRNKEIEDHKEEIRKIQKEIETVDKQIITADADMQEKRKELTGFRDKYNRLLDKINEEEAQYNEKLSTIASLQGMMRTHIANRDNYSNYDRAVKFLMTSNNPGVRQCICGVVGEIIKVNSPKYALAIETALGASISNVVTETGEDAKYLIEYLKHNNGGRATFLPLSLLNNRPLDAILEMAADEDGSYGFASDLVSCDYKYQPMVENLLGRILVVENNDCGLAIKKKYKGLRIVTLDGDNFATSGAMSGGSRNPQATSILGLENEIAEMQRKIDNLQKGFEILKQEIAADKEEKKKMDTAESVVSNIITKCQTTLEGYEKQKNMLSLNKERHLFDIERLRSENNAAGQAIAELEANITVQSLKKGTEKEKSSDSRDTLNRLAAELGALKAELSKAGELKSDIIKKVSTLSADLANAKAIVAGAQKENARLEKEVEEAKELLKQRTEEKVSTLALIEALAAKNSDSEELKKVTAALAQMEQTKTTLAETQERAHADEQKWSESVSFLTDKKARIETALEAIDTEIEKLQTDIRENYQLDYETALSSRLEDYNDQNGTSEGKTLRRDLVALGKINANAAETLAERQAVYDEKKLHYDDICKARDTLLSEVNDLTQEMEKIFTESFEKIKVNFAEIFSTLFDGGHGKLDLDIAPGQSVLDAGIIIEAEPPGKKLQNISLLSGGERALTAICIIFAIIKLHPMPFCVLDEVDAPLDDFNATIYAKFLQKYSKNTQFIIISHRKPTMQLANELYGVTMQEQGVTTRLSVKLSEALKMAQMGGA